MNLSSLVSFYDLLSMQAALRQRGATFSRAEEKLLDDIDSSLDELAGNLALALRDYLWLIALGEARHGTAIVCFAIPELPNISERSDGYYMGVRYAPTADNIANLERLFAYNGWRSETSYGGARYLAIVQAVSNYMVYTPVVYVDNVASICHNGGLAFNKTETERYLDLTFDIRSDTLNNLLEDAKYGAIFQLADKYGKWLPQRITRLHRRYATLIGELDARDTNNYIAGWDYDALVWGDEKLSLPRQATNIDKVSLFDVIEIACYLCGETPENLRLFKKRGRYVCTNCVEKKLPDYMVCSKCDRIVSRTKVITCDRCGARQHVGKCDGAAFLVNANGIYGCTSCIARCVYCDRYCTDPDTCAICQRKFCSSCAFTTTCGKIVCLSHKLVHIHDCALCRSMWSRHSRSFVERDSLCVLCGYHARSADFYCADCQGLICQCCAHGGVVACTMCDASVCEKHTGTRDEWGSYVCDACAANGKTCHGHAYAVLMSGKCQGCNSVFCLSCGNGARCGACSNHMCGTCVTTSMHCVGCGATLCEACAVKMHARCGGAVCRPSCAKLHYANGCHGKEHAGVPLCEHCKTRHGTEFVCANCGRQRSLCDYCRKYIVTRCSECTHAQCGLCCGDLCEHYLTHEQPKQKTVQAATDYAALVQAYLREKQHEQ